MVGCGAEQPDSVRFKSITTLNARAAHRRRRRWCAAAVALPALLLLAAGCGPGTRTGTETAAPMADGAAIAAPPAAPAGGERPAQPPGAADPPPAEQPGPRTLQQLIDSNGAKPFERFLAGPWYRHAAQVDDGPHAQPVEIIHFEPEQRSITFFDGEVQEVYSWTGSDLRTTSRIAMRIHNALVTSVEKTIVADVTADDELNLQVWSSDSDDESDQNGTYRRLDEAARGDLVRSGAPQPGLVHLQLVGLYHGSDGQTILFDAPRFTWQQPGRRLTGGFAVYSAGRPVIVFKIVSMAGTTSDVRTFALEFREYRGAERVRRSLILHPATLAITGLTAVGTAALHFEQVEQLDSTVAGSEDT